jgi:hypothetical protein
MVRQRVPPTPTRRLNKIVGITVILARKRQVRGTHGT